MTLEEIRAALASHTPQIYPRKAYPRYTHASVALLLREGEGGIEILYILRATHETDPWSGNIAFPGGRIEHHDLTDRHAAERETFEELGIDLTQTECLGRVDDVFGAHLPVIVSCFVWLIPATTPIRHNGEVVKAFWVPLTTLIDPQRQLTHAVEFRGEMLIRPAVALLEPGETVLWGITYRLTGSFMALIGLPLPYTPIP